MRVTVVRSPAEDLGPGRRHALLGAFHLSTLWALLVGVSPGAAGAQEVSGPFVPAGRLRVEVSTIYLYTDARFGERTEGGTLVEEEEPLGFDFSDTAVGTRLFPGLETLERDLETATGGPVAPLNLGSTQAVVTRDAVVLPLRVDVGVFDWLSVGGMVPFSRRRAEVAWSFDGSEANAGVSPTVSDPTAVGDFLGGLSGAEAALANLTDERCSTDPATSECMEASALLADGRQFRQALLGALTSQGVFPLDGTTTAGALQSRVQALLAAHQALGIAFPASVPLATQPLSGEDYATLVTDPQYGVVGEPFGPWRSAWEMGDVELFANLRLWASGPGNEASGPSGETSGPSDATTEPRGGTSFLVGAGGLVRLGTGLTDLPQNFVDAGGGDGQQDLELSLFGGVAGTRLGVWGEVRYGMSATAVVLRRIAAPDRVFAPLATTQAVRWTPGNYYQIRLTPRVQLTEEVAIAFDMQAYSKKADTYEPTVADDAQPGSLDTRLLELETERHVLETGVGLVYSTVRSGRGRPMEARFLFRRAVSGSGGRTPKTERFEFGLRLFKGIWD